MSTPPRASPLPEMSVKMLPLTTSFCEPSSRSSPAAPRWANTSPRNSTPWSWEKLTLAGAFVQLPNGQVPPAKNWHSPWEANPFGPGMVTRRVELSQHGWAMVIVVSVTDAMSQRGSVHSPSPPVCRFQNPSPPVYTNSIWLGLRQPAIVGADVV